MIQNDKLLDLTGKRAIVTGGAAGIGRAISYRLAEAGASVLIADSNELYLTSARKYFSNYELDVHFVKKDVSNEHGVALMCKAAVDTLGGIDILVNNAGVYPNIPLLKMTPADFEHVININLKSVFMTTKCATEQMIRQGTGGKIINITSIDALHPSSIGLAHYDASKHGMWGFTKNAALELAAHDIQVNAVAPGGILTPGVKKLQEKTKLPDDVDMSVVMQQFLSSIPMRRLGESDEIGKVVLFLASDMSSYMTGSQIVVDGGKLLA